MSKLSQKERDKLDSSDFALPKLRKFPLSSESHVRLAWDMVDRAKDLTEAEREEARRNILKKAKEMGIDTSNWNKSIKASVDLTLYASTSNILLRDLEHPNRMPFSGILTYFDVPSDMPPGGSGGYRVLIPKEVGEPALYSLKGMAINFSDDWENHSPTNKIGVITDVKLLETMPDGAVPVYIEGYIYANDFEDVATNIKANQAILGFSYETAQTRLEKGEYQGQPVMIATELGYFTGAAVLYKDSAAYQRTSIAANADKDNKGGMKVEELKTLLASSLKELKDEIKQFVVDEIKVLEEKLEPKKEEAQAPAPAPVEKPAEEKSESSDNKPAELNASADLLEAVKSLSEEVKSLKAGAEGTKDVPPAPKAIQYPMSLMAKYEVQPQDDYKKLIASIDSREDLDVEQRLALKFEALSKRK